MAKKIMALVTAIALVVCFAVSASAVVNVTTTTQYVGGSTDIHVNVTVTSTEGEITEGTNVTYYATKAGEPVHIDQVEATDAGATFEFNTADTNLESDVKVGYTSASAAKNEFIEGYTVTYPGGTKNVPNTGVTSVTITYTPTAGRVFDAVKVTAGTADIDQEATKLTATADGKVTVILNTALAGNVTFAVEEEDAPIGALTATAQPVESQALVVKAATDTETYPGGIKIDGVVTGEGDNEVTKPMDDKDTIAANADKVGDRKLTVIGIVTGEADEEESYGIIVSKEEIATVDVSAATFASDYKADSYAGALKNGEGVFAIQLIDTSIEDAEETETNKVFIESGETYYTAIYVKDPSGVYRITAGDSVFVD